MALWAAIRNHLVRPSPEVTERSVAVTVMAAAILRSEQTGQQPDVEEVMREVAREIRGSKME